MYGICTYIPYFTIPLVYFYTLLLFNLAQFVLFSYDLWLFVTSLIFVIKQALLCADN